MRCLIVSAVLSLLPFNPYGIRNESQILPLMDLPDEIQRKIITKVMVVHPGDTATLLKVSKEIRNITNTLLEEDILLKALLYLHDNRQQWVKSAIKAGREDLEPEHLLEILEVEKRLFAKLIHEKQSKIGNHPFQCKKHALASLLTFVAVRTAADAATWEVVKYDSRYNALIGVRGVASKVASKVAWGAVRSAVLDDAVVGNRGTALIAARDAALIAAHDAAYAAAYAAAGNATKNLSVPNQIDRVAYRAAETQAWIITLDPRINIFEETYEAAYSKLNNISEEDLGKWLNSQETFESKLNEYLVNPNRLEGRQRKFLEHIKDHLNRMTPKISPSNEIEF